MTTITIDLTQNQEKLLKENNINLIEEFKQFLLEKLEDMEDIKKADKAYQDYLNGAKTYTLEETKKILGLDENV